MFNIGDIIINNKVYVRTTKKIVVKIEGDEYFYRSVDNEGRPRGKSTKIRKVDIDRNFSKIEALDGFKFKVGEIVKRNNARRDSRVMVRKIEIRRERYGFSTQEDHGLMAYNRRKDSFERVYKQIQRVAW